MGVSKPVYFNEENEKDKQILEFIENKKFTSYVKELILKDMESKGGTGANHTDCSMEILNAVKEIASILRNGSIQIAGTAVKESAASAEEEKKRKKRLDKISKFENIRL